MPWTRCKHCCNTNGPLHRAHLNVAPSRLVGQESVQQLLNDHVVGWRGHSRASASANALAIHHSNIRCVKRGRRRLHLGLSARLHSRIAALHWSVSHHSGNCRNSRLGDMWCCSWWSNRTQNSQQSITKCNRKLPCALISHNKSNFHRPAPRYYTRSSKTSERPEERESQGAQLRNQICSEPGRDQRGDR
jgi:hypothetical protein